LAFGTVPIYQERPVRYALNNSFGFGGHNVSIAFGAYTSD
jgi:3-oxoacyl-(acyl-carrier-protein) synthase